eukprot:313607-Rhodomonas_salina.1
MESDEVGLSMSQTLFRKDMQLAACRGSSLRVSHVPISVSSSDSKFRVRSCDVTAQLIDCVTSGCWMPCSSSSEGLTLPGVQNPRLCQRTYILETKLMRSCAGACAPCPAATQKHGPVNMPTLKPVPYSSQPVVSADKSPRSYSRWIFPTFQAPSSHTQITGPALKRICYSVAVLANRTILRRPN